MLNCLRHFLDARAFIVPFVSSIFSSDKAEPNSTDQRLETKAESQKRTIEGDERVTKVNAASEISIGTDQN